MKKTVYILRGVSGSGKSTVAEELIKDRKGVICTADDYFETPDGYKFDVRNLGHAHAACKAKFLDALTTDEYDVIVVANTNTTAKEYESYNHYAKQSGALVIFLVVENRHDNIDVHNVPQDVREAQERKIKSSLKLI